MSAIVLACMTGRGIACLDRVAALAPEASLHVVSAPEAPGEPRFLAALEARADALGATFSLGRRLDEPALEAAWRDAPSLLLMVNWRFLVAPAILARPSRGAWVFHDSLLPEYRGFSPTVWAIAEGADHTGATLFRAVEEVDAGAVAGQLRVPIGPDETVTEVVPRVTEAYLELLDAHLLDLLRGTVRTRPQDEGRAFSRPRRSDADNRLDWAEPARRLHDLVRAVTRPYPGAWMLRDGRRHTVWRARPLPGAPAAPPGTVVEVVSGRPRVATGDGLLELLEIEGGDLEPGQALA